MSKRPTFVTTQPDDVPSALILGNGLLPGYLLRAVEDSGCRAIVVADPSQLANTGEQFDYIFQFDFHPWIATIAGYLRESTGKMLYVHTGDDALPAIPVPAAVRILRTGPLQSWDTQAITDRILETLFAGDGHHLSDISPEVPNHAAPPPKQQPLPPVTSIPPPPPPLPSSSPVLSRLHRVMPPTAATTHRVHATAPSPIRVPSPRRPAPPVFPSLRPSPPPPPVPKVEVQHHSLFARMFTICFILLILTIGGGVGLIFWQARELQQSLRHAQVHLQGGDWPSLQNDLASAQRRLGTLQRIHTVATGVMPPLQSIPLVYQSRGMIDTTGTVLSASYDALTFFRDFRLFDTTSFSGAALTASEISRAEQKIERIRTSLMDMKLQLQKTNIPLTSTSELSSIVTVGIDQLTTAKQLLPLASEFIAKEGRRTYLVPFQNPMELRPTGGFIGSFALVTVDQGKVQEWKIMDVYEADGQLKGHVEPPAAIRTHLAQPNWFLRDSNFDPDFAVSAQQAAWFVEKELNIRPDGVIGINLFLAEQLLRITGPLPLPDFENETLSASNVFTKIHAQTKTDFFPGSTTKKDMLTALGQAMIARISASNLPWMDVLTVTKTALDEKQILLYSKDPVTQTLAEQHGWAGRLNSVRCTEEQASSTPCIADYLAISEANLGVNKANYHVNKSVHLQKTVSSKGTVTTIVTLFYDNIDKQNPESKEAYKNYLRLIVPRGGTLTGVTINDTPLRPADVEVADYGTDKQTIGFLLTVPAQRTAEVKVAYLLPTNFSPSTARYQLQYQKQPGDKISPLLLSITGQTPFTIAPANFRAAAVSDQSLTFSSDTAVDRVFVFGVSSTPTGQ